LTSQNVIPGYTFLETTGASLAHEGVAGAKKLVDDALKAGGGAIFIDEAYQLTSQKDRATHQGGQVLDFLLAEMENQVGKIVFILAGYSKQMETFFEHNPGLPSRVPHTLKFADYTDDELLLMLCQLIRKKYHGKMAVEDDVKGLYTRIAVRRLGRGRGRDGFGNARALQNMFDKITERQTERISRERREGQYPNDFLMKGVDVIGPDPAQEIKKSVAWVKLQELTGLKSVKDSVRGLFDMIAVNYQRELKEKEPLQMSLNRVFLGSPGTGKTTVGKLFGQILVDIGILSNGEGECYPFLVSLQLHSMFMTDLCCQSLSRIPQILLAAT
jgi:SpoVK/Ycf46/Vps4 family AAA+-type ATPase